MDWVYRQVTGLSRGWLLGALALSTIMRLGYALVVMDPLSGPDAPTYVEAAPAIATQGFNGDIPGVPYWPAGYPAFLSTFYVMSPTHWLSLAAAAQVIMLSASIVLVRDLAIQWAGRFVANSSFLILLFLPSLTAAAAQLMYEVPLGCMLAVWAWLIYKATATGDGQSLKRRKVRVVVAGLAGLALGAAICIQPKVIPLAIVGLVVLWSASPKAARIFYVVGAGLLPGIVIAQNHARFGHWGISWNAGTTLSLRNEGRLVGCEPWTDIFSRDESLVACNLRADLAEPLQTLYLYAQQAVWHLWPLSGPQPSESTWFHALTPWRFVTPSSIPVEVSPWLEVVWGVLAALFVAVPFILGIFAARRFPWRLTVLLASSPVLLLIVSMLVRGDGRFRIPGTLLGMPVWTLGVCLALALVFRRPGKSGWMPRLQSSRKDIGQPPNR